jgi:hypothetical protein
MALIGKEELGVVLLDSSTGAGGWVAVTTIGCLDNLTPQPLFHHLNSRT